MEGRKRRRPRLLSPSSGGTLFPPPPSTFVQPSHLGRRLTVGVTKTLPFIAGGRGPPASSVLVERERERQRERGDGRQRPQRMGDNVCVCVCDCASVLCLNAWLTQGIPLHVALAGFGSNLRAPDSGMFKIDPANYALSRRQVSRVSRRVTHLESVPCLRSQPTAMHAFGLVSQSLLRLQQPLAITIGASGPGCQGPDLRCVYQSRLARLAPCQASRTYGPAACAPARLHGLKHSCVPGSYV